MARLQTLKPRVSAAPASRIGMATTSEMKRTRGSAWMKIRDRILTRDKGLCQECTRNGRLTEATKVDHITPLHLGGSDNDQNLQSLCNDCHDAKTAQEVRDLHGAR
jgi:5-methylcytosine-specific restriction protein A